MRDALIAGAGGFIGTVLRFLLNTWVYRVFAYPIFPYGTFLVNMIGCLLIGLLGGLADSRNIFSPEYRIFIFIGILGGFTTFSSFGYDTFGLVRSGHFSLASLNVILQVFLGLSAVWLGFNVSRLI